MAALTIAKNTLTKMTVSLDFLEALCAKEFISQEDIQKISEDEELKHFFAPAKVTKKRRGKKTSAPKVSDTERNDAEYNPCKCAARLWKPVDDQCNPCSGKYGGLDNVQCRSDMIEGSDFCKKHAAQAEAMGGKWWLGKVNEPRPETPMLPKGSLKKGYDLEDLQPHFWKYDEDGNVVEKGSGKKKKSGKKPKKVTKEAEVEVEAEAAVEAQTEVKVEAEAEVESVDEATKPLNEGENIDEIVDGLDKDEDHPFIYEGVEYIKHWDEDDEKWILVDPEEWCKLGDITDDGSVEFVDDAEREKHNQKRDE